MAKRKIVEVDEEYMKAIMASDIPRIKIARALAAEREATEKKDENDDKTITEKETDQPLTVNQLFEQSEAKKSESKQVLVDYKNLFLIKRGSIPRKQSYISQDVYAQVSKYLRVISDNLTVTAYVDNVMRHHMEQYKDEINELYKQEMKKPL